MSIGKTPLFGHAGKYHLYYTGNYGNGDWWTHRNHQRIERLFFWGCVPVLSFS